MIQKELVNKKLAYGFYRYYCLLCSCNHTETLAAEVGILLLDSRPPSFVLKVPFTYFTFFRLPPVYLCNCFSNLGAGLGVPKTSPKIFRDAKLFRFFRILQNLQGWLGYKSGEVQTQRPARPDHSEDFEDSVDF